MFEKTIVSLATPQGYSAIAIIRLSGANSFLFGQKLCKKNTSFEHGLAKLLPIFIKGGKIDTGVFTAYEQPRSYTGENTLEISCHGNPCVVSAIIERLTSFGAKLAGPGEYTKRAFLNGKIDLSQAESVGLLIGAQSVEAAKQQIKNVDGALTKRITKTRDSIISILSLIEFELDISEEIYFDRVKKDKTKDLLLECESELLKIIGTYNLGSAYTKGLRVVFVGKPNVGKSTIINSLLSSNRSITSPVPGTTRDVITTDIIINGIPITLIDTAGIHRTKNIVEKEGIRKTKEEIKRSDIVLSVFTSNSEPVENIKFKKTYYVYNKNDLQKYTGPKKEVVSISATTEGGIKNLREFLEETILSFKSTPNAPLLTTLRQKETLTSALSSIRSSIELLDQKPVEIELVAHETQRAISQFDITLGKTTTNDILNNVFSSFCVGK